MKITRKEIVDALIGFAILLAMLVGSFVGLRWATAFFGSDRSGMFL